MQPKQIAKKIRENLLAQKSRLQEYLGLLDKEKEEILIEDPDKLIGYIDLEKNIINELTSFQKVIDPLEIMYFNSPYKKDETLIDIKSNISALSNQVKQKSDQNKQKLDIILEKVEAELKDIPKNKILKPTYDDEESRLVDIKG